jgi:RNA-directed DNA polymerase
MQTTLRYWEYYKLTDTFSDLYEKANSKENFHNLYDVIISRENILLAFRIIKANKGSITAGTDGLTINDFKELEQEKLVSLIQFKLTNYQPKTVRRVFIPKPNGDKRPLGIPCMIDRIIPAML